ncbi:Ubiquitin-like-specific protease 1A [Platanthera zijinensis]|uniref:Ubiquitin-like-specific protease 1A n=1 Tax=Platanthera zijinensis TaxID=2320716 RepID=A0AAP0BD65_9ASPA
MFTKYNWPLAIHKHLHAQIADLNAKSVLRDPGENLGYFEGCSVVLLVWIYEHTNLQPVVDFIARPRICRWSSKLSYSSKVCFNLPRTLQLPDQVKTKFTHILLEENALLGEENEDSDFEPTKTKLEKIRAFHDDCRAALPSNILDWKIEDVPGIPKQANGFDCGVFVLKYMETTLSPKEVSWASTKGWHSNMPRYRAEITAEILRIFHDLVLKNIDNLET